MQQTAVDFTIVPLSDRAVLVSFGNLIEPTINDKVMVLYQALQQSPFKGFIESVPAYASLGVFYDPRIVKQQSDSSSFSYVKDILTGLLPDLLPEQPKPGRLIEIPVCYDPEFGIDLSRMAGEKGLNIDEIIALHTAVVYRVYMIGFLPGFAYMGTVDEKLVTLRKQQPALRIPAGSVGIAGAQTGIYPFESPGGWNIIGQTPLQIFDPVRPSPCLLSAGERVRFISISKDEFQNSYAH